MSKSIIKDYKTINVTEKHYKYFIKRCEYWKVKLGLLDWNFSYYTKDLSDSIFAQFTANEVSMQAVIGLNNKMEIYPDETIEERLDKSAFHEVYEIMFTRIRTYLDYFGMSRQLWDEMIHPLINKVYEAFK